ncbi:MAG: hypothetical protein A2Y38_07800 [Spirochaetes bacterium GWB1_59_5]|nr:MAG: hypothetical protein A2Y38_07800 [Spirochaetes bacterium GWB1_59_5]
MGSAGYQKLPGGLILQWGELVSAGTSGNIILPIAFPNEFFAVFTSDNKGGPDVITVGANRTSLSQFAWYGTNTSTGASAVPQTWSWFALGR